MTGSTRIVAAAAIAMMLSGCDWLIEPEPDIIYLVPEQFAGWMCVDFDVKTAPPLPRENSEPTTYVTSLDLHDNNLRGGRARGVWRTAAPENTSRRSRQRAVDGRRRSRCAPRRSQGY
jgi:hypothetical protein